MRRLATWRSCGNGSPPSRPDWPLNGPLDLCNKRHDLQRLAKEAKETDYDMPFRPICLKSKPLPAEVRDALDGIEHVTDEGERAKLAQRIRDYIFPDPSIAKG